jgi:general secretion pathway protein A
MYCRHFGLNEPPFGLTPDPRFFFRTDSFLEALSSLKYGIEQNKGIVLLTGEVGTGKTTTLRAAIKGLGQEILAAYIFNPYLTVAEFFEQFSYAIGLPSSDVPSKAGMLNMLGRFLVARHQQGLKTALIVDEAHGLSMPLLEEIRLLLNFETDQEKLLQIVLCGQPELEFLLNKPQLRQLKQRVSLRGALKPLTVFEVDRYIRFRLKVAGAENVNIFEEQAVRLIYRASAGIPRVINNVCDNALLFGYAATQKRITRATVEEVIDRLGIVAGNLEMAC